MKNLETPGKTQEGWQVWYTCTFIDYESGRVFL